MEVLENAHSATWILATYFTKALVNLSQWFIFHRLMRIYGCVKRLGGYFTSGSMKMMSLETKKSFVNSNSVSSSAIIQ